MLKPGSLLDIVSLFMNWRSTWIACMANDATVKVRDKPSYKAAAVSRALFADVFASFEKHTKVFQHRGCNYLHEL